MNETLKWTLWILGGLLASLVSGFIFVWMTMGYKVKTPLRIRILSFPFLIGGIPFAIIAWCVIMIVQHFSGTNTKHEGEPVKKTGFKRINCDTTDAGLHKELDKAVDLTYDKLMKEKEGK